MSGLSLAYIINERLGKGFIWKRTKAKLIIRIQLADIGFVYHFLFVANNTIKKGFKWTVFEWMHIRCSFVFGIRIRIAKRVNSETESIEW